jgi:hypothetical protein
MQSIKIKEAGVVLNVNRQRWRCVSFCSCDEGVYSGIDSDGIVSPDLFESDGGVYRDLWVWLLGRWRCASFFSD